MHSLKDPWGYYKHPSPMCFTCPNYKYCSVIGSRMWVEQIGKCLENGEPIDHIGEWLKTQKEVVKMNLNYHINESTIKCPFCDKECDDADYEVSREIDNKVEFECEHCGKVFWAEANVCFTTEADCALNGEKHDWEETHIKGFFRCKNCPCYEHQKIADAKGGE